MSFSLKNWNKSASNALVLATGIVGNLTIYSDQVLSLLHEAPFTVSPIVDQWIVWILKLATTVLTILSVFTKKQTPDAEQ